MGVCVCMGGGGGVYIVTICMSHIVHIVNVLKPVDYHCDNYLQQCQQWLCICTYYVLKYIDSLKYMV